MNGKTGQLTNIVNNLDRNKDRVYEFDTLGRLITTKGGVAAGGNGVANWMQNYGYDRFGNRTSVSASGITANNQAVPLDGIASSSYDQNTNRITDNSYEYDVAGNLTKSPSQNPVTDVYNYEYDAAGRLVAVKDKFGNILETYAYGASRQRLRTISGALTTYYAWGGSSVLVEYSETTNNAATFKFSKSYIYAGSRLLSTQMWNGSAETTEFHHPDRLGTKLVTNNATNTHYEQSTLPFGTSLDAEFIGSPTTNQRFTSYERSQIANLDYAVNRSYSSGQGRFTSVDPIGMASSSRTTPQSNNLYAYVRNNPIDFIDPSGLFARARERYVYWQGLWRDPIIRRITEGEPRGRKGGGEQKDNPPRSGPCNLQTPDFEKLNSISGNPAAYKLLMNTHSQDERAARVAYNTMTPYNQAVFLNTVAAVNAQSPNLLSSAKFEGFYNGYNTDANAKNFGINVSGVTAKDLKKSGLVFERRYGEEEPSWRSPGNIDVASVEATVNSNSIDFDVDLFNAGSNNPLVVAQHGEEVAYNKIKNATTHPADVVRKLNARGITTGVSCK